MVGTRTCLVTNAKSQIAPCVGGLQRSKGRQIICTGYKARKATGVLGRSCRLDPPSSAFFGGYLGGHVPRRWRLGPHVRNRIDHLNFVARGLLAALEVFISAFALDLRFGEDCHDESLAKEGGRVMWGGAGRIYKQASKASTRW